MRMQMIGIALILFGIWAAVISSGGILGVLSLISALTGLVWVISYRNTP